jgi:HemY protein
LLARRGAIEATEAQQLIETSATARLQAGGIDGYKAIWGDLKAQERSLPDIALAAAAIQESQGNHEESARILETAIAARPDPRLLNAYAQCPPDQVARRLSKAELWLRTHPENSALLAALGNLCLIGQLWGQGERYLLRSMRIRSDMRIHALLGNLYDRLGRQTDAMTHWRLASGVAGTLPVLPMSHSLPAADTRADPTLIDAGSLPEPAAEGADAYSRAPVAASAADYDLDDHTSSRPLPASAPQAPPAAEPPKTISADSNDGLDDYFDSAPIPGVDLSQTSDRPYRGSGQH